MKYYSGVGSRNTPTKIMGMMTALASKLASEGWTLRSGAAQGADSAFEEGVMHYFETNGDAYPAPASMANIYIPWRGFVEINADYKDWYKVLSDQNNKLEAEKIAASIHPAWERCSRGAKALHTRNVYQVLGQNLNAPSSFLVCWAETGKDGKPNGGTRTAWVLAEKYGVKCFNLFIEADRKRIEDWIK